MHATNLQLLGAVLLVAIGLALIVWDARRGHGDHTSSSVHAQTAPAAFHTWSRHELGLLHRLGARLIVSRYVVADADFEAAEQLMARAWLDDPYVYRAVGERVDVLRPLLQLEEMVERMESLSARMRSWRPGRARGQG